MDRPIELLDNACSANGLAWTKRSVNFICPGGEVPHVAMTHERPCRDPKVTRAPRVGNSESPERQRELVVVLLANTPRTRAKLDGK